MMESYPTFNKVGGFWSDKNLEAPISRALISSGPRHGRFRYFYPISGPGKSRPTLELGWQASTLTC